VEDADPHRLLQLVVALDLHVGVQPVRVEHLALLAQQPLEAGQLRRGQGALDLVAQRRGGAPEDQP
jgi:hypothetical protein